MESKKYSNEFVSSGSNTYTKSVKHDLYLEIPFIEDSVMVPLIQLDYNKFIVASLDCYSSLLEKVKNFLNMKVSQNLDDSKYNSYAENLIEKFNDSPLFKGRKNSSKFTSPQVPIGDICINEEKNETDPVAEDWMLSTGELSPIDKKFFTKNMDFSSDKDSEDLADNDEAYNLWDDTSEKKLHGNLSSGGLSDEQPSPEQAFHKKKSRKLTVSKKSNLTRSITSVELCTNTNKQKMLNCNKNDFKRTQTNTYETKRPKRQLIPNFDKNTDESPDDEYKSNSQKKSCLKKYKPHHKNSDCIYDSQSPTPKSNYIIIDNKIPDKYIKNVSFCESVTRENNNYTEICLSDTITNQSEFTIGQSPMNNSYGFTNHQNRNLSVQKVIEINIENSPRHSPLRKVNLKDTFYCADNQGYFYEYSPDESDKFVPWKKAHDSAIIEIATHHKNILFTCDSKNKVIEWNSKTREIKHIWGKLHQFLVKKMVISKSNNFMFSISKDCTMKKWDIVSKTLQYDFEEIHEDWILSACIQQSEEYIFTTGNDLKLKQWSISSNELTYDFGQIHDYPVNSIVTTDDNKFLFSVSDDGFLKQWNISEQILEKNFDRIHDDCIKIIVITPCSEYLLTGSDDKTIKMWNIKKQTLYIDFGLVHGDWIRTILISRTGEYLISISEDNCAKQKKLDNLQPRINNFDNQPSFDMKLTCAVSL